MESFPTTCARISGDMELRRYDRTCWSLAIQGPYRGFGSRAVVLSAFVISTVLGGAASELSRSPVTCAPRRAGSTWVFQRMKFPLASFSDGGEPRLRATPTEEAMVMIICGSRVLVCG